MCFETTRIDFIDLFVELKVKLSDIDNYAFLSDAENKLTYTLFKNLFKSDTIFVCRS
jgi:hypothetical protein